MRNKSVLIFTGLALFAILLSACSAPALAQTPSSSPAVRTLSVGGTGKTYLNPDIAYITIGVHTENPDVGKAVAANNTQAQKVANVLEENGIDPKDIQTTGFSIYPQQQYDQSGQVTGTTYVVDNQVYVTVRDLAKLGDLLDVVVKAGANSISGIQFDVENKDAATSQARDAAVKDAEAKAQELAKSAGVTLGELQSISESTGLITPYFNGKGGGAAMEAAQVPIAPGQLTVTVDVNLVYTIQ
jgi:hypothetical protein